MPALGTQFCNKMIGGFPASVTGKLNNRNEILHLPARPSRSLLTIFCANYFLLMPSLSAFEMSTSLMFECVCVFISSRLSLPVWFYRSLEDRQRHKDRFRRQTERQSWATCNLTPSTDGLRDYFLRRRTQMEKARMVPFLGANDLSESSISSRDEGTPNNCSFVLMDFG